MKYFRNFGLFWYDFIVGDDWRIATGIVGIMVACWMLGEQGIDAWWIFSLAIVALLFYTVKRAAHD